MTPCITIKELIIDLEGASDSECEFQDLNLPVGKRDSQLGIFLM